MSSFSLRPRLLILLHKGRQWLNALQPPQALAPLTYCASTPVAFTTQREQQVLSGQPLQLPQTQGRCAVVELDFSHWHIQNDTRYTLPDLELKFYPPGETEALALELTAGEFHTFEQGQARKQLLTYWATLLHCDLEPLGWQVQRTQRGLKFSASPLRAGWNVKGRWGNADPRLTLPANWSSWDEVAGEPLHLVWGPYQWQGQRYHVRLPYDPTWTLEDAQQAIHQSLLSQGLARCISWVQGRLQLQLPAHTPIQRCFDPDFEDSAIHRVLDLDLNTGSSQAQQTVHFEVNQQLYTVSEPIQSPEALLAELQEQAQGQPIQFAYQEDQEGQTLTLMATDLETPLHITAVSSGAATILGLRSLDLSAPRVEYNKRIEVLQEWFALAEQYLSLLKAEEPLFQALQALIIQWRESEDVKSIPGPFSQFLDQLDEWMLASEKHTHTALWQQLAPPVDARAVAPSRQAAQSNEKSSSAHGTSQFDHKI